MKTCQVCSHPERAAIDTALVAGTPLRSIAKQHVTSSTALFRHKNHLAPHLAKAAEAAQVADAGSLLDQVKRLMEHAKRVSEQAEQTKQLDTSLRAIREMRGCLELLAKLTGELQSGTNVSIANIQAIREININALSDEQLEALLERLIPLAEEEKNELGGKLGIQPQFNVNFRSPGEELDSPLELTEVERAIRTGFAADSDAVQRALKAKIEAVKRYEDRRRALPAQTIQGVR